MTEKRKDSEKERGRGRARERETDIHTHTLSISLSFSLSLTYEGGPRICGFWPQKSGLRLSENGSFTLNAWCTCIVVSGM